jgi:hypothetical protein
MCIASCYGLQAQNGTDPIPAERKGKWGYVNQAGKKAVSFKYEKAGAFSEGLAPVRLKGKWGYINKAGKTVIPLMYYQADVFFEGVALVRSSGNFFFIDRTGKKSSPVYDAIGAFSAEGVAIARSGTKVVFVDRAGREIGTRYEHIGEFSAEGVAVAIAESGTKIVLVDRTGRPRYERIGVFSADVYGMARVELGGKSGYVDKTGKEVIPVKYDSIGAFSEYGVGRAMARVESGGKFGYVDTTGEEVIPVKYDSIDPFFSYGMTRVESGGKSGYVDKTGREVIPVKYDRLDAFSDDGMARVESDGKSGYVDKTGREVIPVKYDSIGTFSEYGVARVKLGNQSGFVDKTGRETLRVDAVQAAGKPYGAESGKYDIVELLENRMVEVEIRGSDITSVQLRIRRLAPYPVLVRIPVGSFFVSRNPSAQNMVATGERNVRLTTGEWQTVFIPAACANRPKDIPGSGDRFGIQHSPNREELARLMPLLNRAGAGTTVKQAAVWIITDDADYGDLGILVSGFARVRAIGPEAAARAMKICTEAGIDITRKEIWRDRQTILSYLPAGALKKWLENFAEQQPTGDAK